VTVGAAALLLLAGVAGAPGTDPAPAPALAGAWLFGDHAPEPKDAVVTIPQRCYGGGVDFTLREAGVKLTGDVHWTPPTQGVPPSAYEDESETLAGSREGDHVVLVGKHRSARMAYAYPSVAGGPLQTTITTVKYDLRRDPRTGHLVGTRDGRRFWLARFRVRHALCGPPPP